ncbi:MULTISPECIES: nitrate ABC transporter substrate-binding protein [Gordonibacter]|uniref:Nitrate ABC transporter substrate-binding protein n=1 Tax=Gordonibacter faecis TaxID=3047475 RepID=A0ABT7DJR3_9ACTN|nr:MULTISPECIES: nitrate ABC transporter substrate-binding protein [unclassified Gordonibacter]MDJ1649769.1 nitrate ABC transporter substrate-binding protein [Gordonibacter sp. KGMB12511]HIW75435.1 nitrate ABC transporter substrate-binding protein [Candidatus Gordonibacter avicola]
MPSFDEPVFRDTLFHRKRKHDKWDIVDAPTLEAPVADTHTHLQLLPDPALSLARAAANGVVFVCTISDVYEDGAVTFDQLGEWEHAAGVNIGQLVHRC